MSEQHNKFLERLRSSSDAVFAVALWFFHRGYSVHIPKVDYASDASQFEDYVDDGDLYVTKVHGNRQRIEVKGKKGLNFTGSHDWPKGFNGMFMSNVAAYERADPKPDAYFIVSADLRYAAILHAKTKPFWTIRSVLCSNTGNYEDIYSAPVEKAVFIKLGD
jgi:hypothetical protein